MNIKKHIPNAITCCNLICGCLAIVKAMHGDLVWASYLVGMAAIFDFFDGFAARLLKVSSPIGKDLDSLADMVTFGVVPGIIIFQMFNLGLTLHPNSFTFLGEARKHFAYFAIIIPVFSALRLAKFNNDTRQSDSFIGVPTPANAILIGSLMLILGIENVSKLQSPNAELGLFTADIMNRHHLPFDLFSNMTNPAFLCLFSMIMSFLLVAELPLFALKFKHFKWKGNEIRFTFLGFCALMLTFLQLAGIPLCIVLYILLSVVNNLLVKKAQNTA